jgi:hypothetical protein
MSGFSSTIKGIVFALLCLQTGAAFAQQGGDEYSPVGARVGTFFFYPSVTTDFVFDDNVFSANVNKTSDMVLETTGQLLVRSDMPRHKLDFEFSVKNLTYLDNSSENHTEFSGGSLWRIDVDRSFNIAGTLQAARLYEGRGSAEAPGVAVAAEPTAYVKLEGSASLNKSFNRLMMSLGGAIQHLNYSDVKAVGGGTIDQDVRDGVIYTAVARASYEFSPGYRMFAHFEGNRRDFKNNRDSRGVEGRGGVEFEITRLVKGEVSAGYLHQNYLAAGLNDINSLAFNASVDWTPTPLMNVSLSARRLVSETTVAGASGRLDSVFGATVDYEVLRNVILSPHASYQIGNYKGVARNDKAVVAGVGAQYLINRYLAAKAFYEYQSRKSNVAGQGYDKNRLGGSLRLQF